MASTPLRQNREFLLLWSGQAISQLGSRVSLVASPLLVLAVTGSPAKARVVAFARNIPIAAAAGGVPYALILGLAAIDGTGFVLTSVAERGALRHLVAPEQLGEAVARNESRMFGAMLAGPPLGGLLFGIGRAVPFVADAASYAISTVSKLLIRSELQEARGSAAVGATRSWSASCSRAPGRPRPSSRSPSGRLCWRSQPPDPGRYGIRRGSNRRPRPPQRPRLDDKCRGEGTEFTPWRSSTRWQAGFVYLGRSPRRTRLCIRRGVCPEYRSDKTPPRVSYEHLVLT